MSKIKNSGLDQYGAEPFEQQQFSTAGVEGLKLLFRPVCCTLVAVRFDLLLPAKQLVGETRILCQSNDWPRLFL